MLYLLLLMLTENLIRSIKELPTCLNALVTEQVQNWISQGRHVAPRVADRLNLLCNQYSRDINFLQSLRLAPAPANSQVSMLTECFNPLGLTSPNLPGAPNMIKKIIAIVVLQTTVLYYLVSAGACYNGDTTDAAAQAMGQAADQHQAEVANSLIAQNEDATNAAAQALEQTQAEMASRFGGWGGGGGGAPPIGGSEEQTSIQTSSKHPSKHHSNSPPAFRAAMPRFW
ncbi:hypothetical protein SeLEV6574_g07455 [Synchytrium endobioticum]|uniref:Uncharacterized protein n=1 Tax=Synchytrium endobioticum TaxID=286115 RepID=A0A507CLK9_9FUNG|nr:hypothetical protein SeLEV6574_g07455 [Synchytrium endobioticum]